MHQIVDLVSRDFPGVFAASIEFTNAARTQAKALGCDPLAVYIPHPTQDFADDEIRVLEPVTLAKIMRLAWNFT